MMNQATESSMTEEFMLRCRAHGLKITPQRLAIFKALAGSKEHPSADGVYRKLIAQNPTISFDTVNRTLLTFAEIGIIETVESHSGVRRFDTDLMSHHHLHCVQCGKIIDFTDETLDKVPVPEKAIGNFTVLGKRMVVSGICESCRKKHA
ncbi:MAG: transcriptional repressor [Pelodictyon luteolum]|uniref:Transcriptional repressor n=1 Tax=Pelodictyon luteolum TaxID=1100 RepID=A0A165LBK4_PELLU|nr:Fur family transcriptional regulator [Pelodictyon luteolum]KZK73822.1 MAG: transcriptional repressor [Pelodictyon luteolum]